jgi:gliding motility-associated-like protein
MATIVSSAQVGREFWFVAPDITSGHGDEPLVFRITTADLPAVVTVSMPANSSFAPVNLTIPANTHYTHTVAKATVENRPSNRVNNKGVLISSNTDITVYYEVANGVNPDKFTLKGHNALGTDFLIPSQNEFRNRDLSPIADEKIDLVATEDNTTITIVPTQDVVGHNANEPFTITLNRGQTFCIEYQNESRSASLYGTSVISDKLIAVTISDDSIWEGPGTGPYDLIGDQLIPTNVIGTEYIAVNTSTDSRTVNKVYVLAVEDDTYVFLNNSNSLVKKLDRGEQAVYDINSSAIYLRSTKPVYAYQLASFWNRSGNEIGSAILPTIACTGSERVSFTRSFTKKFYIQLLTKGKNRNSFILRDQNGNRLNDLDNISWQRVQGTDNGSADETWYSVTMPLDITTGAPHSIQNTQGLFHMSILDENQGSVSYGYFSSFGTLRLKGPTQECQGNAIVLSTEEPMKNYLWYSDLTGNAVLSTESFLEVRQSATYWVTAEVNFGGCTQTDSLEVEFLLPEFELSEDTALCAGEVLSVSVDPDLGDYYWSDGSALNNTNVSVAVNDTVELWLQVSDQMGCTQRDTMLIACLPQPVVDLSLIPNAVCLGDTLFNNSACDRYQWQVNGASPQPEDTLNYMVALQSGTYSLTGWNHDGCSSTASVNVTVNSLPTVNIPDLQECPGESEVLTGPAGMSNYLWMDGSVNQQLSISQPDTVWLEVTDTNGCMSRDTVIYSWYNETLFNAGNDTSACVNSNLTFTADNTVSNYSWYYESGGVLTNLNHSTSSYTITNLTPAIHEGDYIVRAQDGNGCALADTMNLQIITVPSLSLGGNRAICEGDTIQIEGNTGYVTYQWGTASNPNFSSDPFILVAAPDTYTLTAQMANGCENTDQITVSMLSAPTVTVDDDFIICPNTQFALNVVNFSSPNGDTSPTYQWSTGASSISINASQAGTYTVLAFDDQGCFDYDEVIVSEHSLPVWSIDPDTAVCENTGITLRSPLNPPAQVQSYQWQHVNSGATSNSDWNTTQAGSYVLSIVDLNSCPDSDTIEVSLKQAPSIDLGPDKNMCEGEMLELSVGDTFAAYQWNNDPSDRTSTKQVQTSGNYQLRVWNDEGCYADDNVQVTVNPLPVFDLGPDVSECAGELLTLQVPAGSQQFQWSHGASTTEVDVEPGQYALEVEDANGCAFSDTIVFTWLPIPEVNLGPDTMICPVNRLPLRVDGAFAAYEWHNGQTGSSIIAEFSDTVNTVMVQSQDGCWGFDSRIVKVLPEPDYHLPSDTAFCALDTLYLDGGVSFDYTMSGAMDPMNQITGGDILSYTWQDGSIKRKLPIWEAGEYWVKAFDGCHHLQDTVSVVVHETPVIARLDTTIYGQIAVLAEGGTQPYSYRVNEADPQTDNVFRNLENGIYHLEVMDVNGCMALDTVSIFSLVDIDFPNFFTPNNDGYNDRWELSGMEKFPDSEIRIYDRFGKLLIKYLASDPGWDGRYMNQPVPSDAYWYVIHVKPIDKLLKGHLTLKR